MDRINKLNSKKIIQKDLGESIEWRRRYWEIYAKNIKGSHNYENCDKGVTFDHV